MSAGLFIAAGILAAVMFHEAAHFAAAKAFGMKTTEFFVGFGTKLWSFRKGETEYGLKLLPLGGYVRIVGMHPGEEVDPAEEHRTYRGSPFWQKTVVVLAGIVTNLALGFVLIYSVFVLIGIPGEANTTVAMVLDVDENGEATAAATSGLMAGDTIVGYDGLALDEWATFREYVRARPGVAIDIEIDREGAIVPLTITPGERQLEDGEVIGYMGLAPDRVLERLGVVEGLTVAWPAFTEQVGATVTGLGRLLNPVNLVGLVGDIAGGETPDPENRPTTVVGIVAAGDEIQQSFGWAGLLGVLASLNIVVALFNLIPVLPFDGGHAAIALYQKVTGKQANFDRLAPVAIGVIVLFMGIFLIGLWFDIFAPAPVG
ncbi:MAG: RIP metalloprotease [Acidimicrobiia bacterium]|nr:RIP metalloprotease [Acidimicrobiia bacterium]NNL27344.1 RIP metalloprotease [Acidimicrobiia bacterium]